MLSIWAVEDEQTGTQLDKVLQQEDDSHAMSAMDVTLVAKKQQKKVDQVKEKADEEQASDDQSSDGQSSDAQSSDDQAADDSDSGDQSTDDSQSQSSDDQQSDDDDTDGKKEDKPEKQAKDSDKQSQASDQSKDNPDDDVPDADDSSVDKETKQVVKEHWQLANESMFGSTGDLSDHVSSSSGSGIDLSTFTFLGYVGLGAALRTAGTIGVGLLYAMEKTVKLLFTGIIALKTYVHRRMNSFESILGDIKNLKNAVRAMDITANDEDDIKSMFSNTRVINNLKISDSVDFTANLTTFTVFMAMMNKEISEAINRDLKLVGYLADTDAVAFSKLRNEGIYCEGFGSVLSKDPLEGYSSTSDYMQAWRSHGALPGDTVVFINAPSTGITDKASAEIAFNKANCGVGIDTYSFREIDEVEYLDKAKLLVLIDRMEKLCLEALSHRKLYESVIGLKSNMRFKFKVFFAELMSTSDRVFASKKVTAVHFRMQYIDKIYLKMSMDVHDLCVKVLLNSLNYAQKNSTKL